WEEGERGRIRFRIKNIGGDDVRGSGEMRLGEYGGFWDVADTNMSFPSVRINEEIWTDTIAFYVRNSPDESLGFLLYNELWASGVKRGENKILIPHSPEWVFDEHFDRPPRWEKSYAVREGYINVWRWDEEAGQNSGAIAFGGPDTLTYPPQADGAYELPLMIVAPFSQLSVRHKMTAEPEYDGGLIEVNWGGGWERLVPEGGYNGQSVNNGSFPGGACWTGSFDWRWDHLSLGEMSGAVRIRLRFGSDEGLEMAGWFVDQIALTSHPQSVIRTPLPLSVGKLFTCYPNPTNSSINIKLTGIEGEFDLKLIDFQGRLVGFHRVGRPGSQNGHYSAIDFPTVNWVLSYLPAGVYIISAHHKEVIQREKIVLLK
ncbi:MAG: T9SS type A sorting domain-containing protein, partial [bacterium]